MARLIIEVPEEMAKAEIPLTKLDKGAVQIHWIHKVERHKNEVTGTEVLRFYGPLKFELQMGNGPVFSLDYIQALERIKSDLDKFLHAVAPVRSMLRKKKSKPLGTTLVAASTKALKAKPRKALKAAKNNP